MMFRVACAVKGCEHQAVVEVLLYDIYLTNDRRLVFTERDHTCPYLCACHLAENEFRARGKRLPRIPVRYPYSNRNGAQGHTIYRNLEGAVADGECTDRAIKLLGKWQHKEGGYSGELSDPFSEESIRELFVNKKKRGNE